eukprot:360539-Chlamydomonas_euryale.AAC.6
MGLKQELGGGEARRGPGCRLLRAYAWALTARTWQRRPAHARKCRVLAHSHALLRGAFACHSQNAWAPLTHAHGTYASWRLQHAHEASDTLNLAHVQHART